MNDADQARLRERVAAAALLLTQAKKTILGPRSSGHDLDDALTTVERINAWLEGGREPAEVRHHALREAAQACRELGPEFFNKSMHDAADACAVAIERLIAAE